MTQMNYLQSGTEVQHRELELELDLLRSPFTRADYVGLLDGFHGFLQAWEPAIESLVNAELPDFFEARKKLRHIESDLRFLGYTEDDLLHIQVCTKLPELKSIGAALGSLYVLEGSTLGGRILTRHFGEHLGLMPTAGCRYFAGYGENTGAMWRAFGELVESRPASENDDMLSAAILTFDRLGDWLTCGATADASGAAASAAAAASGVSAENAAAPAVVRRILVAEDDITNQIVMEAMLEKYGFQVKIADSGLGVLELFPEHAWDLILMDCQMPKLDGFGATKRIREIEGAEHHTPIIALTANALAEDRQRCLDAGMDDYLTKPIGMDTLLTVLTRWNCAPPRPAHIR